MSVLVENSEYLGKRFIKSIMKDYDFSKNPKLKLKDIINDYWDDFLIFANENNITIRDVVTKEIEKIRGCGCLSNGYYTYICDDCDEVHYCPFRCNSRFCPSCGIKSIIVKTDFILKKLVNVDHRHLVFTIPEELRTLFLEHRKVCIDILFEAVNDTIKYIVKKSTSKKDQDQEYVPGFISTLHTFGRDLKWNPHIHVILAECVSSKTTPFKRLFIPYEQIRKSFQFVLLKKLEKHFGVHKFRALKNKIYSHTENGLYVFADKDSCSNPKDSIKYIIRYHGRPAIAQSRIISCEGGLITFWYDDHKDGKRKTETLHIFDFFKRLIVHIQDEYTNTIRYYGFYNKPIKQYNQLRKLFKDIFFKARECIDSWRNRLRYYFGFDPLICKSCGKVMTLASITIAGNTYFFDSC